MNIKRYLHLRANTNTEKSEQKKLFQVTAHICTHPRTLAHTRISSVHTTMSSFYGGYNEESLKRVSYRGCVTVQEEQK